MQNYAPIYGETFGNSPIAAVHIFQKNLFVQENSKRIVGTPQSAPESLWSVFHITKGLKICSDFFELLKKRKTFCSNIFRKKTFFFKKRIKASLLKIEPLLMSYH